MFGLSEAEYNAVKAKARECGDAIKRAIELGSKYDQVAAKTIDAHYAKVELFTNKKLSRLQFVYIIGYLNGRFSTKGDYE